MFYKSFTCNAILELLFHPREPEKPTKIQAAWRGISRPETGETAMIDYIESAKRETGDTNVVTFLTTAIIAMAAVLLAATSFALV